MAETLMSPSTIKMYGRVVTDLTLDPQKPKKGPGANGLLHDQLTQEPVEGDPKKGARLARIYAMSFEGTLYTLPKPAIFVVHGEGDPVPKPGFAAGGTKPDASGLAVRDFAWEDDLRYWSYDKDDVSLRLDVVTGPLDEILIDATLSAASRYAITSRAELAARAELAGRAEVAGRAELVSRAELTARHRLR